MQTFLKMRLIHRVTMSEIRMSHDMQFVIGKAFRDLGEKERKCLLEWHKGHWLCESAKKRKF
jgi:hypothetical protein